MQAWLLTYAQGVSRGVSDTARGELHTSGPEGAGVAAHRPCHTGNTAHRQRFDSHTRISFVSPLSPSGYIPPE